MRFSVTFITLLAVIASVTTAQNCSSISAVACRGEFSVLCRLLKLTDLDMVFDEDDEYTLFAPSNQAFARLGATEVLANQKPPTTLEDILMFHVALGKFTFKDLNCTESLEMLNGKSSRTTCAAGDQKFQSGRSNSGGLLPQLVITDVKACNGIVHAVNNVMLP